MRSDELTQRCYNFNSIKVRLEPQTHHVPHCKYVNFNSIKVRLEHLRRDVFGNVIDEFQFHKGAIRTK